MVSRIPAKSARNPPCSSGSPKGGDPILCPGGVRGRCHPLSLQPRQTLVHARAPGRRFRSSKTCPLGGSSRGTTAFRRKRLLGGGWSRGPLIARAKPAAFRKTGPSSTISTDAWPEELERGAAPAGGLGANGHSPGIPQALASRWSPCWHPSRHRPAVAWIWPCTTGGASASSSRSGRLWDWKRQP